MNLTPQSSTNDKASTGIVGFDEITRGGLPRGRTTILAGGAGSGKTIFAMQFLAHGVASCGEPGLFVAFEEAPQQILANFESFGLKLAELGPDMLGFLDAQPAPDLVQSGSFDFGGLLAALHAKTQAMAARRIVFDALDIMLALLPDAAARRREIHRLHGWLIEHRLTAVITAKDGGEEAGAALQESLGFMQFMVDCAVVLNHRVLMGISQRSLRVQKYRGSGFDENESPFVISSTGFDVAVAGSLGRVDANATLERVSSGVERLDKMLGGGYYRGSSVLITGFPGTAKTTLSGAFTEAACRRGERTLFVSFDSECTEIVRNLGSVGMKLDGPVRTGLLKMVSARTVTGSAETLLVRIKALAKAHEARCLVIDPVSMLSQEGNEWSAHGVAERLIEWTKSDGITLFCTSLLDEMSGGIDGAKSPPFSTVVDTWIHLNYLVQAGERNRGLSIIKSRGTAHSNQVRELILSEDGVTLADTYTAGGEVLMGTLRWEKESAARAADEDAEAAKRLDLLRLDAEEAVLEVKVKSLQTELVAKQVERTLLTQTREGREGEIARGRTRMRELRGADAVPAVSEGQTP